MTLADQETYTKQIRFVRKAAMNLRILALPKKCGNPYTELLYSALEVKGAIVTEASWRTLLSGRYDVLHVHWPEAFLNSKSAWRRLAGMLKACGRAVIVRIRGKRLVWTVHNIRSHESTGGWMVWVYEKCFQVLLNGIICINVASLKKAVEALPALQGKPTLVTQHGHYKSMAKYIPSRLEARATLSLQEDFTTLGFVGLIRRYKNVTTLVHKFRAESGATAQLLIAGKCKDEQLKSELNAAIGDDHRIRLFEGFFAQEQLPFFMAAMDVLLLPYKEPLNSGTAILGLSFGVRIAVTDSTTMRELAEQVGSGWVKLMPQKFDNKSMREVMRWAEEKPPQQPPDLSGQDWERIADDTCRFMRSLVAS